MSGEIAIFQELLKLVESLGPVTALIVFVFYVTYMKPVAKDVVKPRTDFTAEEKLFLQDHVREPVLQAIRGLKRDE